MGQKGTDFTELTTPVGGHGKDAHNVPLSMYQDMKGGTPQLFYTTRAGDGGLSATPPSTLQPEGGLHSVNVRRPFFGPGGYLSEPRWWGSLTEGRPLPDRATQRGLNEGTRRKLQRGAYVSDAERQAYERQVKDDAARVGIKGPPKKKKDTEVASEEGAPDYSTYTVEDWMKLKGDALRRQLGDLKRKKGGNKEEMSARLYEHYNSPPDPEHQMADSVIPENTGTASAEPTYHAADSYEQEGGISHYAKNGYEDDDFKLPLANRHLKYLKQAHPQEYPPFELEKVKGLTIREFLGALYDGQNNAGALGYIEQWMAPALDKLSQPELVAWLREHTLWDNIPDDFDFKDDPSLVDTGKKKEIGSNEEQKSRSEKVLGSAKAGTGTVVSGEGDPLGGLANKSYPLPLDAAWTLLKAGR